MQPNYKLALSPQVRESLPLYPYLPLHIFAELRYPAQHLLYVQQKIILLTRFESYNPYLATSLTSLLPPKRTRLKLAGETLLLRRYLAGCCPGQ